MLRAARNQSNGGRGGGRYGRGGRFQQRSNNNSNKKKDEKKKLKKFHPMMKGKSPEFSFEEVKKELVKTLELMDLDKADDIIDSVRDMTMINLASLEPNLAHTEGTTCEAREHSARENEKKYDAERKVWQYRKDALADNKRKLHGKILKFCSEDMTDKLE